MTNVAVIGNTSRNLGAACAADLTLAGHRVRYAVFPDQSEHLAAVKRRGGFLVEGDETQLVSRRTGMAQLDTIFDDPASALAGADVVMIDTVMPTLETRFASLIEALPRHVVVHVQSHGYWPAARLTPLLNQAGRTDVLVTEATAPTHAAGLNDGVLTAQSLRRGIEVATMPGRRIEIALVVLRSLFPDLTAAPSVLQTGLESMNLVIHPAMALLGVGLFEQAARRGQGLSFYRECNSPSAGLLADALDAERGRICAAYGVRHRTVSAAIERYYQAPGKTAYESVLNCAVYQALGDLPATTWRDWESVDVPYAIAPLVKLAEQAQVAAPLHRAVAEILGTLLGINPWTAGPSLQAMNLAGTPAEVMQRATSG